ncbi:ketopantoate reductase family protein [Pelagibius sp. Alg239-R121]|uniref:ketopantoate reductase family protein n=1 Tax=Pelagibius sp. Alg239-R121 TaxID=2993448 RepID=UPI0024A75D7F|nr:2-dehydropantoate 2-reductase [Pelagibius sp. Alg239-R121]
MKVAVIGAGAMGSIYAGLLADAGNDVWAIDLWREHLDSIRTSGLRVEGASGDRLVKSLHATDDPADADHCDLYIIATKAAGVGAAARSIAPLLQPQSLVLTIQNGLGSGERIAEHLPVANVLLGVADGFGASMKGPGHVHHNAMNLIRIGEMQGGLSERLETVASIWRDAGFNVRAFADINQLIWEKFICNCTFSAPCTVFNCTLGELMSEPRRWKIALGCTEEVFALGQAMGIAFAFEDPIAYVTAFGTKMPDARPSMLLDHHAFRPSEIDAINGMVPVLGEQLGIATPYNEVLTEIVRAREATFVLQSQ